jgi:serine/threonine-protein kinase
MANIPSRIGNFEIIRQIGSGGMGAVYLGRDLSLNRQVAIKVIRGEIYEEEALNRFFHEARAAAALRHPNIITIYASGTHEHLPYMVMEFVEGESLAQIIMTGDELPILSKLSYLEQLCSGLHFAHRAGIIHRDIKPANVMIDRDGMLRILDFGIARIEGSAMTQGGAMIGSVNYMSPEQMLGKPVDYRSDVFSVGSLGYELLSYQQAFKGSINDGLLQRLPYEDPPSLSDICPNLPIGLEGIIVRALQKAPEDRFQDLGEMRTAIMEIRRRLEGPASESTMVLLRDALHASLDGEVTGPRPSTLFGADAEAAPDAALDRAFGVIEPTEEPGPPAIPEPPPPSLPASPEWRVKRPEAAAAERARSPARQPVSPTSRQQPSTPAHTPPSSRHARTATTPQAQTPSRSSRKWIAVGTAAAAVVVGVAVGIPWLIAASDDPMEQERPRIEAAMERFRIGYRNRDLQAVVAAFPALPADVRQAMERTFSECLIYEVIFDGVSITAADSQAARADVMSTHTCTPQSAAPERTTRQHDIYTLTKNGERWSIQGVTPATPTSRP